MATMHSRVLHHILSSDISYTVRHHRDFPSDIRTPADFAHALGYELARITKSVFCRSQSKARYVVLVGSTNRRLDLKQAARCLDMARLEIAGPQELQEMIGYPRHGVSPFGLNSSISVVVARGLLGYESVLVGAGAIGVEIEITPRELVDATNALVDDI
jgi:Cys-tRNA(Pro)/Cys-tRNA(Cys) deacylase